MKSKRWLVLRTLCVLGVPILVDSFLTTPQQRGLNVIVARSSVVSIQDDISLTPLEEHRVTAIDPLLTRVLLLQEEDDKNNTRSPILLGTSNLLEASTGLAVWRNCLCKGRLPVYKSEARWPVQPALFEATCSTMTQLQLPRFVLRHPETVNSVLLYLVRMVAEYGSRLQQQQVQEESRQDSEQEDGNDDDGDYYDDNLFGYDQDPIPVVEDFFDPLSEEQIALEVATGLIDEFGGVVSGIQMLDQLFGYNHGLMEGFGLQDGVWQHTGWKVLPQLQRQIASMSELRDMMKVLGRRPTAEQSNAIHRFRPRQFDAQGAMGAQLDTAARTSVSGLTLSNSLSEMLPSEAVLLKGSPALRRLFLAKKVESKLLSYELSGWADTPSVPRTSTRYLQRMPSAPGGPLIVCLDTSWSMSGRREWLSKAVVLACVSAAHKQHRTCKVVAFSSARGVMDAGEIVADAAGIHRLLEFLSHSFGGGGTDVTGALQHAMATIGTDEMAAADLLLVTDGEIPDPPVSDSVMEDLDRLKQRTGMQVHGLLVGKSASKPLDKLCTQTHDFLSGYDDIQSMLSPARGLASSALSVFPGVLSVGSTMQKSASSLQQRRVWGDRHQSNARRLAGLALRARRSEDEYETKSSRKRRKTEGDRWNDEYAAQGVDREVTSPASDSFNVAVDESVETILSTVSAAIKDQAWQPVSLDNEKEAEESCWRYRDQLRDAVARVNENLVERDNESRLVVLGLAAGEHVLFLGPPGTAKSALGRRLSKLCGGSFFQRLLTRFTTPEEIFGPLSLRALENDEYKRCTEGFLPTASIAFLDEIFKANSAILNTLLTILNEREFDNGAGLREECPIRCVIAASNELPESDELDALYDRFLLRKEVLPVSDDGLMKMLSLPTPGTSPCDEVSTANPSSECDVVFKDGLDSVVEALSKAADKVHIGNEQCCLLRDLRSFMREELDVDISDRRLVKAARLLKVSAASHGRTSVDPIDCLLLQHVTWRLPEQHSAIREWLWDHLTPGSMSGDGSSSAAQYSLLLNGIRQEGAVAVRKTNGDVSGTSGGRTADIAVIDSIRSEASQLTLLLQRQSATLARHIELLRRSMDHLWLDPDEARASQQLLIPKAETALTESNRLLANAHALVLTLSDDEKSLASPSNEARLSVLEHLWDDDDTGIEVSFTEEELSIGMREAKAKYEGDTFRRWKRERKKASK